MNNCVCVCDQFECGAMIQEEAPAKLCEAFRLFLQGQGYGTYRVLLLALVIALVIITFMSLFTPNVTVDIFFICDRV